MEFIKKANVPMVLLVLCTIRSLMPDVSVSLAIICVALSALYAYRLFLDSKITKPLDKVVLDELSEMKSKISNISVKNGIKPQNKENQRYF